MYVVRMHMRSVFHSGSMDGVRTIKRWIMAKHVIIFFSSCIFSPSIREVATATVLYFRQHTNRGVSKTKEGQWARRLYSRRGDFNLFERRVKGNGKTDAGEHPISPICRVSPPSVQVQEDLMIRHDIEGPQLEGCWRSPLQSLDQIERETNRFGAPFSRR